MTRSGDNTAAALAARLEPHGEMQYTPTLVALLLLRKRLGTGRPAAGAPLNEARQRWGAPFNEAVLWWRCVGGGAGPALYGGRYLPAPADAEALTAFISGARACARRRRSRRASGPAPTPRGPRR